MSFEWERDRTTLWEFRRPAKPTPAVAREYIVVLQDELMSILARYDDKGGRSRERWCSAMHDQELEFDIENDELSFSLQIVEQQE